MVGSCSALTGCAQRECGLSGRRLSILFSHLSQVRGTLPRTQGTRAKGYEVLGSSSIVQLLRPKLKGMVERSHLVLVYRRRSS
jgi:hypothetical protein